MARGPMSAAQRRAISEALKRYYASKGRAGRASSGGGTLKHKDGIKRSSSRKRGGRKTMTAAQHRAALKKSNAAAKAQRGIKAQSALRKRWNR